MRLEWLPEPDRLDFTLPERHISLITNDGSPTTVKLAQCLIDRGWNVVVLSFPRSAIATPQILPDSIPHCVLSDWSEAHLQQELATVTNKYGSIATLIHLHPVSVKEHHNIDFSEAETDIVREVFLLAKHLKKPLCEAAKLGRTCFMTVARLDGAFGLMQTIPFSPIGAGLFGLTKSLNYEWKSVFCRAIDLNPNFNVERSVQSILAELYDPNRSLIEVGYSDRGRTTLICDPLNQEE
ncbi:MAG: hypothetical protein ACRC62_24870 [Microcoleus sp.]